MLRAISVLAFAITTVSAAPAMAQINPQQGIISMNGSGEVFAAPDMAVINSGVVTFGKTARIALDANTEAMNELFFLFEGAGVDDRDIQTSQFSIQPRYIYSDQRDENGYPLPPRISGYQVSNTLSVKVRELNALGSLLDQAVSVGSNQINSISFSVSNPEPLQNEARRAAMVDAIAKAQLFAEAAGVKLGDILSISEASMLAAPPFAVMEMARSMGDSSVPIAAGEQAFSQSVSVVWKLDQD
ncbi:MAG: SIMPL domain-containing protein [Devosiaceae bacterium]|nr:SIMPL domain-containing protein [Devosiaceae bacterium]